MPHNWNIRRASRARLAGLTAAMIAAALSVTVLASTRADAAAAFTSTIVNTGNSNCATVPGGA